MPVVRTARLLAVISNVPSNDGPRRDQRIKGLKDNDLGWIEGCAVAGQIQPAFIAGYEEEEEEEEERREAGCQARMLV